MKNYSCPYCDCSSLTRYGKVKNIQRYKCKQCSKTFRETSGTPLFGLHKVGKVDKYLKALRMGMSVRKAARYVGISNNTSFIWRHKFLSSLKPKETIDCNDADVNIQIITMEYSAKGRQKAPEKNRKPSKTLITQRSGQICLFRLNPEQPVKHASAILKQMTDSNYIIAMSHKLLHSAVCHSGDNKKVMITSIIKTSKNCINSELLNLQTWMERFKGVASKYLQQYWNWYVTVNNLKTIKNNEDIFNIRCSLERNLYRFQDLIKQ